MPLKIVTNNDNINHKNKDLFTFQKDNVYLTVINSSLSYPDLVGLHGRYISGSLGLYKVC